MHDARHIANEFIRRARQANLPITNLHVQKLVYFAHARMMSIHGEPLIRQEFEAWRFGPVIPVVYHALKQFGEHPIAEEILYNASPLDTGESDLIDRVFNLYGRKDIGELIALTHAQGGPWEQAYTPENDHQVIPNTAIERFHLEEWRDEARDTMRRISEIPRVRQEILEGFAQVDRGEYTTIDRDELAARS